MKNDNNNQNNVNNGKHFEEPCHCQKSGEWTQEEFGFVTDLYGAGQQLDLDLDGLNVKDLSSDEGILDEDDDVDADILDEEDLDDGDLDLSNDDLD